MISRYRYFYWIGLFFVICQLGHAQALNRNYHYLFDFESGRYITVKYVKPNRVHYKFVKEIGKWAYTRATKKGTFPSPLQVLATGTVVNGAQLGAKTKTNYQLEPDGSWKPTKKDREYHVWKFSKPPQFKIFYALD